MKKQLLFFTLLLNTFISFSQNFEEKIIAHVNDWAQPKIIDLDNDGLNDLVSVSMGGTVAWWKNDNTSNFTKIIIDETHKNWNNLDVYDIDGDSDLDILVSEFGSIEIYYNDGNQNFTPSYIYSNSRSSNVIAGDFDSDGINDFITTSRASNGKLKFWKNYGNVSSFFHGFLPTTIATVPIDAGDILVNDIDNDGDLDLIMSVSARFWNGNHVKCYLNDGNANFTEHIINYTFPNEDIQIIDYDNDGDKDFIINSSQSKIVLFSNDGSLNFTTSTLINQDDLGSMHMVDYDDDGDLDIAVVVSTPFPYNNLNYFGIYVNDGNGVFTLNFIGDLDKGDRINSLDFNNDNLMDFMVTSETFDDPIIYENTGTTFNKIILDDTFYYPSSFYADDIDNDGLVDIVSTSENERELVLWHNNGSFDFTKIIIDNTEPIIKYAHIDDINNDGYKDILVTTNESDQGQILLYSNDGNMNFTKSVLFDEAYRSHAFSTDIDGDGDLDIVYSVYFTSGGEIRYKRNDGGGNYQTVFVAGNLNSTLCLDYVDVNNDGYKDLITNKNKYFKNDGSQNFTEVSLPASGTMFDIDGDNDLDILSSRYEPSISNTVISWFENIGNDTFTEHQIQTGIMNDGLFTIQDFDGDGDIDFISAPISGYNSSKLSYWINDGNQNFTKTVIDENYLDASHLLSDDFDGDGDIDILSSGIRFPFTIWKNLSDVPLSVENQSIKQNNIQIFPNPTQGIVNIIYPTEIKNLKIEIYNIVGQKILDNINLTDNKIDISQLKKGNYILRIISNTGSTSKIITKVSELANSY